MFERYAIFYTPPAGPLADFGARWLGWDSATGRTIVHRDVDIANLTKVPRKYGFHGTLKAPFRLAKNTPLNALYDAAEQFAARHGSVVLQGMELRHEHGFVALRPSTDSSSFNSLIESIVRDFDHFRAPLTAAEIARRRKAKLSPRQDQQMLEWGYPYIFEDFHFHLTLSGSLDVETAATVIATLKPLLADIPLEPFQIDAFTLMGQDADGMFHQIHRYALTG